LSLLLVSVLSAAWADDGVHSLDERNYMTWRHTSKGDARQKTATHDMLHFCVSADATPAEGSESGVRTTLVVKFKEPDHRGIFDRLGFFRVWQRHRTFRGAG
jgi:hypothetical protein